MRQHEINHLNNFIGGWYIDHPIIDELIEHFHNSKKEIGRVGRGVDKSVKESTDVPVLNQEIGWRYMEQLQNVLECYMEKYPMCSTLMGSFHIHEGMNIQLYNPPSDGFHMWHTEKSNVDPCRLARHLVFMTYLNTVEEGGETEFLHQQLKVKPEKGLTLIWGSDWTFAHRGNPPISNSKMIITGWYGLDKPNETSIEGW